MAERVDVIAQAIFDWLTKENNGEGSDPPYTYNDNLQDFVTGVDGYLDCKALALVIDKRLSQG